MDYPHGNSAYGLNHQRTNQPLPEKKACMYRPHEVYPKKYEFQGEMVPFLHKQPGKSEDLIQKMSGQEPGSEEISDTLVTN